MSSRNVHPSDMTGSVLKVMVLFCLAWVTRPSLGDTVVMVSAELSGGNSRPASGVVVGDYKFTFGKDLATVSSPNGKQFVLDFAKKSFTGINPNLRTYYQTDIASVLEVGDRLPATESGSKIRGSVTFDAQNRLSTTSEFSRTAQSYRVLLESTLIDSAGSPNGFGIGISPRGGISLGGGNSNSERTSVAGRRILEGQLWMDHSPVGVDRDQMNTALECLLLWGSPQMKELAVRIHNSNLAVVGGEFSLRSESQQNAVGITPPIVIIKVKSISDGVLDLSSLSLSQQFRRVSPPTGPLGG